MIAAETPRLFSTYRHRRHASLDDIQDIAAEIIPLIILVEIVSMVGRFCLRGYRQQKERQRQFQQSALKDKQRARFEREEQERFEAERPARLEKELAEIKAQLQRLSAGKHENTSNTEPPPRSKSTFTGSIKTEKEALEVFDLAHPFTASELKKRRASLLQKTHPDQGGSNMLVRLVNEAYDILKVKV